MMGSMMMNSLSVVDGSLTKESSQDIKQLFQLREGYYKNLPAYEYSRPNKSNITTANIGQGTPQANLPVKIAVVHVPDDESGYQDRILFNVGRELFFYHFKSIWEMPDLNRPLDRQLHKVQISAYDMNLTTLSQVGYSLLIGFVNGSFQIYDPRKETHLFNEDRLLDKGRVTCAKWLPGSSVQFVVGFSSGQLFQCDESLPWLATPVTYQMHKHGDGYSVYTCKSRSARNPVYRWTIGQGALNAIAFSPCQQYLASVSHDGFLRIFHMHSMDLLGTAKSYFGGLVCLCWSPDSKFICAAGEDDLIHVFCLESRKIVARGRGHKSWVTAIAFDSMTSCLAAEQPLLLNNGTVPSHHLPLQRITTYRFASVGQDTQICLWELTDDIVKQSSNARLRAGSLMASLAIPLAPASLVAAAPPPSNVKTNQTAANIKRGIGLIGGRNSGSGAGGALGTGGKNTSALTAISEPPLAKGALGSPVCPKLEEVPLLEPLVCKRIAPERLNDIVFHEDCILISTQEGVIMTWSRPDRQPPGRNVPISQSSRQDSSSN